TPDRLCLFSLWSSIVSYTNSFPTRRSSDLRETRLCLLGPLQRGGQPTTFDRVLATQFGAHAVRLIVQERFGEMICSRPPEMTSRSEEHTSELQSRENLVCRLLLEKKKNNEL